MVSLFWLLVIAQIPLAAQEQGFRLQVVDSEGLPSPVSQFAMPIAELSQTPKGLQQFLQG